jgi:hypothetical protein
MFTFLQCKTLTRVKVDGIQFKSFGFFPAPQRNSRFQSDETDDIHLVGHPSHCVKESIDVNENFLLRPTPKDFVYFFGQKNANIWPTDDGAERPSVAMICQSAALSCTNSRTS